MTRRRAVTGARLIALALAAGCANQTTWIAPPTVVAPGPVNGLLLDGHNRPLPDHVVAIGAEKTTTNAEGRFAFAYVPVHYDLVVASPDRVLATVYQVLGVDQTLSFPDRSGRPISILTEGEPIREIL